MSHCISLEKAGKAGMAKGPTLKYSCGDTAPCSSAPYLYLWQHTAFIKFKPLLASHWPNQHSFSKIHIYIFPLTQQDGLLVRAKPKLEGKRAGSSQGPMRRRASPAHGFAPAMREEAQSCWDFGQHWASFKVCCTTRTDFFLNNANNPTAFQFLIWLFQTCQQQA